MASTPPAPSLLAAIALLALATSTYGQSAPPAPPLAQALADLDSDRYSTREQAERTLRDVGLAAIPALELAARSESPEVRRRARQVSHDIQHTILLAEFTALADRGPTDGDLEYGMWLIARIDQPLLERATLTRQLDELAERFRRSLPNDRRATELPAREAVDRLAKFLFVDERFAGNQADYDAPANSSLDRVLATRKGLPITLSHLMIAVGRRVGLPLVGLMVPGRYMLKYDPPPGHAEDELVIDAFNGGKIYTADELEDVVAGLGSGFDPATHLKPAAARDTIARMLRNLASDYRTARRPTHATRTLAYLSLLEPD